MLLTRLNQGWLHVQAKGTWLAFVIAFNNENYDLLQTKKLHVFNLTDFTINKICSRITNVQLYHTHSFHNNLFMQIF